MKITRWNAEISASKEIISKLFELSGLEPKLVQVKSGSKYSNQKTYMSELIQMVDGELIFNLSGTQFVLRPGDKVEIPANTSYSFSNMKEQDSSFIVAQKI